MSQLDGMLKYGLLFGGFFMAYETFFSSIDNRELKIEQRLCEESEGSLSPERSYLDSVVASVYSIDIY